MSNEAAIEEQPAPQTGDKSAKFQIKMIISYLKAWSDFLS